MAKGEMLVAHTKSMVNMARMWEASRKAKDSVATEQKELHFKMANLEKACKLGVVT